MNREVVDELGQLGCLLFDELEVQKVVREVEIHGVWFCVVCCGYM